MSDFPLLAEVAPGRPASGGKPAVGPTYRNKHAKDGFPTITGVTTLYELFRSAQASSGLAHCVGVNPDTPTMQDQGILPAVITSSPQSLLGICVNRFATPFSRGVASCSCLQLPAAAAAIAQIMHMGEHW